MAITAFAVKSQPVFSLRGFGIQPSVSSSFLLALAHVATQSNDSETASSPKLQNPRYVLDFHLPLELPGL
ncbi:hypothetical protein L6452_43614 [Arctium lappa]|uniref:Uncharacterized protein n=1 Tax=Arctium lappa TaxID=4217 RepID=A0ACB8XDR4_ARCLA|nr:hypothetical protein L6452_43614 [Arctium lappa]